MSDPLYREPKRYDSLLPVYLFAGRSDQQLVDHELSEITSLDAARLTVLEIGPGTGRMTELLMEFASRLVCVEASAPMVDQLRSRFPDAVVHHADVRDYVGYAWQAGADRYDLIASFWSLNYPLLDCFESNDGKAVVPRDEREGHRRSRALIDGVLSLLKPHGTFLALFFDPDSEEQRFVTDVWEEVAPFPGSGRGFTRALLMNGLRRWERSGYGTCTCRHEPGEVVFNDNGMAESWFLEGHFKGFPDLMDDTNCVRRLRAFIGRHQVSEREWRLGAGVYIIRFQRSAE
jgi:SAM-dependent methyltransferase